MWAHVVFNAVAFGDALTAVSVAGKSFRNVAVPHPNGTPLASGMGRAGGRAVLSCGVIVRRSLHGFPDGIVRDPR